MPNNYYTRHGDNEFGQLFAQAGMSREGAQLATSGKQRPEDVGPAMAMVPILNIFAAAKHEKRNREALAGIQSSSGDMMESLLVQGIDVDQAKAITMMHTARRLQQLGFAAEGSSMRAAAADQLKVSRDSRLKREETTAKIANDRSTTRERDEELEASSLNYVLFNKDGKIEDWKSIPMVEDEVMRDHEARGYIQLDGNLAGALSLTAEDFASRRTPPPMGILENMAGAQSMLTNIQVLRSVSPQTGFIEGPLRSAAAKFGITAFDNDQMVNAIAVRKKMRADIQSLVKGIPSNYDAGIFEAMIPDPGRFAGTPLYDAQLDLLEETTKDLVARTIAYYKGTKSELTPEVVMWAAGLGVDVSRVAPMAEEYVKQVKNDKGKAFEEQNNPFSRHARMRYAEANANFGNFEAGQGAGSLRDEIFNDLAPETEEN